MEDCKIKPAFNTICDWKSGNDAHRFYFALHSSVAGKHDALVQADVSKQPILDQLILHVPLSPA